MRPVIEFLQEQHEGHVEELGRFLAIPSVSALPQHAADLRRCARWTAEALTRAGLRNVGLIETAGNPIVYGDWLEAPGAPTVLLYGHYDVQPADPLELWESPPFEATVRDGKLYARGASDDKGQVFMHFKAIEGHLRATGRLPVNVKVIVEGEEEVGGSNLETFVRDHRARLAAEVVVISDGAMFERGRPSMCRALRGMAYFQVDLRGTTRDLHSGSFGGAVANPALVLAQVLARMKGGDGAIAIPGFYDTVRPLTAEERAELARLSFDEAAFRAEIGAPELFGEAGYTTLERLWARPTFDVNGLLAGFTGEGAKTVIPAAAMAKVSMRLVPDQDPDEIGRLFETHLRNVAPSSVEVTVTQLSSGRPWAAPGDGPFCQAGARALRRAFGVAPVFTREGGSNPIVPAFEEILGVPVVLFDLGLRDDCPHAPNEKLDLQGLRDGVMAAAYLYDEIGKCGASRSQPT